MFVFKPRYPGAEWFTGGDRFLLFLPALPRGQNLRRGGKSKKHILPTYRTSRWTEFYGQQLKRQRDEEKEGEAEVEEEEDENTWGGLTRPKRPKVLAEPAKKKGKSDDESVPRTALLWAARGWRNCLFCALFLLIRSFFGVLCCFVGEGMYLILEQAFHDDICF